MSKSSMSSIVALFCNIPIRLSFFRKFCSISDLSSSLFPNSDRAIPLIFESIVLYRHSSRLFLSPYSPIRFISAANCSWLQGFLGFSYFLFCFLGSPIKAQAPLLTSRCCYDHLFLDAHRSSCSSRCLCPLTPHLKSQRMPNAFP